MVKSKKSTESLHPSIYPLCAIYLPLLSSSSPHFLFNLFINLSSLLFTFSTVSFIFSSSPHFSVYLLLYLSSVATFFIYRFYLHHFLTSSVQPISTYNLYAPFIYLFYLGIICTSQSICISILYVSFFVSFINLTVVPSSLSCLSIYLPFFTYCMTYLFIDLPFSIPIKLAQSCLVCARDSRFESWSDSFSFSNGKYQNGPKLTPESVLKIP